MQECSNVFQMFSALFQLQGWQFELQTNTLDLKWLLVLMDFALREAEVFKVWPQVRAALAETPSLCLNWDFFRSFSPANIRTRLDLQSDISLDVILTLGFYWFIWTIFIPAWNDSSCSTWLQWFLKTSLNLCWIFSNESELYIQAQIHPHIHLIWWWEVLKVL